MVGVSRCMSRSVKRGVKALEWMTLFAKCQKLIIHNLLLARSFEAIKHSNKICSPFGGHFISIKFPPTVGIGIISLPLIHLVIFVSLVHDKFCFMLYNK
jgi:hypothetical protein